MTPEEREMLAEMPAVRELVAEAVAEAVAAEREACAKLAEAVLRGGHVSPSTPITIDHGCIPTAIRARGSP